MQTWLTADGSLPPALLRISCVGLQTALALNLDQCSQVSLIRRIQRGETTALGSPCPPPSGAAPVPDPQLPRPRHSCMPFPRALSLSHTAELSAAPPLPVRSCSLHEASPQLLCSGLSQQRDLRSPSCILSPGPLHPVTESSRKMRAGLNSSCQY